MKYREQILEILEDMGIFIDDTEENILLQEYIVDSIQFITFIVKIEEKFDFVFPDEFLVYDAISTIDMVEQIISMSKNT